MKRFWSIIMIFCLFTFSMPAFAASENQELNVAEEEVNYMNYNFPDDAVVLYQKDDGVVYQTHDGDEVVPYSTEYESVYIPAGKHPMGTFNITNPHTITNKTEGTFKIESSYKSASAQFILSNGITLLANKTIYAKDGDVRFSFKCNTKKLVCQYYVHQYSSKYDMRLMCWLW